MKYNTINSINGRDSQFIVSISDSELMMFPGSKLERFENLILSRLANIIVGWLFKHKRDELIKPILDNVVTKISIEVSQDILHRLGLPLNSDYEK